MKNLMKIAFATGLVLALAPTVSLAKGKIVDGTYRPEVPKTIDRPNHTVRPDRRFTRRRAPTKTQPQRPPTLGKPYKKVMQVLHVVDGMAKVRLPPDRRAGTTRSWRQARNQLVGVGFVRLANGVSERRLKGMVGHNIEATVQADDRGKLILKSFRLTRR